MWRKKASYLFYLITDAYKSYPGLDARYIHVFTVKHEDGGYLENW